MPNNYLSVLYQHIIQVENKNVGLKVEGHKHTIAPPVKKVGGGAHAPLAPPASYASAGLLLTYCPRQIIQWVLECVPMTGVCYNSLLWIYTLNLIDLTWLDLIGKSNPMTM